MQECFGLITITSRDSKVQYSSGHGGAMETLPATPTADRVTNALRAVQRRFRPVWWHRLPEGLDTDHRARDRGAGRHARVLTLKVADRSYHRDLPSMWADLGAAPGHAEAAPPLDDPRTLQLMAALGASQEARGWALHDDLGISADEALERLRELEDFGLIKGYRRFLESRRDEDRWYRITPVGDFALGSHLAATRQDAHA